MHCLVCNHDDTRVIDSRSVNDGLSVRRRRECSKCDFRFSTYEQAEILDITVVKNDGHKEPYSREKLVTGLKKALEKRSSDESLQQLIGLIERDVQKLKKAEVTSQAIGEIVMRHLRKFDKVAYIRFASVYRSFEDVQTFQQEVASLMNGRKAKKVK